MKYFSIEPEVAGGLGKHTVIDRGVHPPRVSKLHYRLDGWRGDALLKSFPCFIVTEAARDQILAARLRGARFDPVEVTTSYLFEELHPGKKPPKFAWLRVEAAAGLGDFGTTPEGGLVVSEKALDVLRKAGLSNAIVLELGG